MKRTAIALLSALVSAAAAAEAPFINPAEDHLHLGDPEQILFWTPQQKVAGFRNPGRLFPLHRVSAGTAVRELETTTLALGAVTFRHEGETLSIDDYFTAFNTAALLVVRDGVIVYERYALGNSQETLWNSFSVAKSVTSMLVGAAIRDGYIGSVDEYVTEYLPQLRGSAYEGVTLRHILQMTTGVGWDENYADPDSDINLIEWPGQEFYQHLQGSRRIAGPGEVFNYSTAETQLMGDVVRAATGKDLSNYLSEKIWGPFGMEFDAYWQLTAAGGAEFGGSSLYATLRDWARLGLFALAGGVLDNGQKVLADNWMEESKTPSAVNSRYGFQWWLGSDKVFEASGIFGQSIYIDPDNRVVIAQHSARNQASDKRDWTAQAAAFRAITDAISCQE